MNILPSQRIQNGFKKRWTDHRDSDFHKSFGTIGYDVSGLPDSYSADAGLTMPDQNLNGYSEGCTGYAQTDICTDEDKIIYDAGEFYLSTPPGTPTEPRALRDSLNLLVNRGPKDLLGNLGAKRTRYYNIRATGILDWFDAIRVALYVTSQENRSATTGVPWFSVFESVSATGILQAPDTYTWSNVPGHNAKISGWKTLNGIPYLLVKSWQGNKYGDNGWCYMPREIVNSIFSMNYTEAFTVTKITPTSFQTVDLTVVENINSFIQNLLIKFGVI